MAYFKFQNTLDPQFQHLKDGLLTGDDMRSLACSFTIRNQPWGLEMLFGTHRCEPYLTEDIQHEKGELYTFLLHTWSNDEWKLDSDTLHTWLDLYAKKDTESGIYYSYCVTNAAVYIAMIRPEQTELCVVRCYNRYFAFRVTAHEPVRSDSGQLKFCMDLTWQEASIVHTALMSLAVSKPDAQKQEIHALDKRLLDGWNTFQNGLSTPDSTPDRSSFEVIQNYTVAKTEADHG